MKNKVYLAGGMKSDWTETVKSIYLGYNIEFFDPSVNASKKVSEYVTRDLHQIINCDICFAYMEKSNPSGYGMAAEIGYAKAMNKTVILVIEPGHEKEKYFDFLKKIADVVYFDLDDAIEFLKTF